MSHETQPVELRGEDALLFTQVREFSPQWEVALPDETPLARVTERFPLGREFEYVVSIGNEDTDCRDRDEVVAVLLSHMPERFR